MKKQYLNLFASASALTMALALGPQTAQAATYYWTGASNQDWHRSSNWRPARVPTSTDDVIIGTGFTINGSDRISVGSATIGARTRVNLSGNFGVARNLSLDNVTWKGSGNLKVNGAVTIKQTSLSGSGYMTFNGPVVASNSTIDNGETLLVNSTFSATDCVFEGSKMISISPTGTLTFQSVPTTGGTGNVINRSFSNSGSVVWASGNLLVNENFTNHRDGIVDIQSSGQLSGREINSFFNNTGTVRRNRIRSRSVLDIPYTNTGLVSVEAGTLEFAHPMQQTAGRFLLAGGDVVARGGMKIRGGIVDGIGTINGDFNLDGGELTPGRSPGSIIINGNYTQSANGTLNLELGGLEPGTGYDQLVVNGTASLAGTLNLVPYNGFTPGEGTNFELLDYYSVIGKFSTVKVGYPPNITFTLSVTPIYVIATAHVSSDTTIPTASVKSPLLNTAYTTLTSATGVANDNVGVKSVTVRLYRYGTAVNPTAYWAGGATWTAGYSEANERLATGTTNWSIALPSLPYGNYSIRPQAKDAAGNVSLYGTIPFLKTNGTSGVGVSTVVASSSTSTIKMPYTGPLDSVVAVNLSLYTVTRTDNSQTLTVKSVAYSPASNTVTLTIASGALIKGSGVKVAWANLFDASGKLMKGTTSTITVQ